MAKDEKKENRPMPADPADLAGAMFAQADVKVEERRAEMAEAGQIS